jgi:CHAT domain-containing protein
VGNKSGGASTLSNLMLAWYNLNTPRLAVFYGKQAINSYQALRQSQLSLLQEKDLAPGNDQDRKRSKIVLTSSDANALKPFKKDPKKPYAHPYYWAPFILIGNWK